MIQAERVRVEHMRPPVVIDRRHPLISWWVSDYQRQGAYKITAEGHYGTTYDSGVVISSSQQVRIPVEFQSRERVKVRIRLWDDHEIVQEKVMKRLLNREGGWSEISFEMALTQQDWQAEWISPELMVPDKDRERPAGYLKQTFHAFPGAARLYITAHGIYNVYLNGIHLDGFVMAPGTSEYAKILQYQTYDITPYLVAGENEIVITLGNGWWRGTTTYDGIKNGFGDDVSVLAQLEIDGKLVCKTDDTWLASQEGPLRDTDNMTGEVYDARREIFMQNDTSIWHGVKKKDFGYKNLRCSNCPPPVEHEQFHAELVITPKGEQVLDFGQNIAGYVSFEIEALEGDKLILTHAETLDAQRNFCMSNFQSPHFLCEQKIYYICKIGKNVYKPTNTFMGFRYVKIEGDCQVTADCFTAHAVYTDLEPLAAFVCGKPQVNQLFANAFWSLKGNLLDLPTDCPTREKSSFTGDLVVYMHTFLYLMDAWPMVQKVMQNLAASQYEDGCVKQIVADPRKRGPMDGSAGWSNAFEILPYKMGNHYDDYTLFEEYEEQIRRWGEFLIERAKNTTRPEHLNNPWHEYLDDTGIHWGEWAEPSMDFPIYYKNLMEHGEPEVGTAYLAGACAILAEEAERRGKLKEEARYRQIFENAARAYRYAYTDNGRIYSDRMCRYIRPMMMNLLDEAEKKQAAEDLNTLVIRQDYRLNTGFLTTHELCRTLSDYGYVDTAYRVLLQENLPGWMYSVRNGATTIPENWDAYGQRGERNASFNHYAYGAVVGWLMDTAAGIRIENDQLVLCPKPFKELGFVQAEYDAPKGRIRSDWHFEGNICKFKVEVPSGYHAVFQFPSGEERKLKPGMYIFEEAIDK